MILASSFMCCDISSVQLNAWITLTVVIAFENDLKIILIFTSPTSVFTVEDRTSIFIEFLLQLFRTILSVLEVLSKGVVSASAVKIIYYLRTLAVYGQNFFQITIRHMDWCAIAVPAHIAHIDTSIRQAKNTFVRNAFFVFKII